MNAKKYDTGEGTVPDVRKLYYRVIYIRPAARYDRHEIRSIAQGERRTFRMNRCKVTMRHMDLDLLLHDLNDLCFALMCSDMTQEEDLKHRML